MYQQICGDIEPIATNHDRRCSNRPQLASGESWERLKGG
jgi:hypothetical protein